MSFQLTLVWRPGDEQSFRGDYVTVEKETVEAAHAAAFEKYAKELEDAGYTPQEIARLRQEPWDLCALLRGHCSFVY